MDTNEIKKSYDFEERSLGKDWFQQLDTHRNFSFGDLGILKDQNILQAFIEKKLLFNFL